MVINFVTETGTKYENTIVQWCCRTVVPFNCGTTEYTNLGDTNLLLQVGERYESIVDSPVNIYC